MNIAVATPLFASHYEDTSSMGQVSYADGQLIQTGGLKTRENSFRHFIEGVTKKCATEVSEENMTMPSEKNGHRIRQCTETGSVAGSLDVLEAVIFQLSGQKYLIEALVDVDDLDEFAAEDNLAPPSEKAKDNARQILKRIVPSFPRVYGIFPWGDEGVLTIQPAHSPISIFCDADGAVSVFVSHSGEGTDERHSHALNDFIMQFIHESMEEWE